MDQHHKPDANYARRLDGLFAQALDYDGDLDAWLDQQCGQDAALKTRLTKLVQAARRTESFFDTISLTRQMFMADLAGAQEAPLEPGAPIGPFKVTEKIGEGGLALVYDAQRSSDDFTQRAAIKVLRKAFNSAAQISDFKRERQILSRLEHPGIARLIDGGELPDGRPWLAMEYVSGAAITHYAEANKLSVENRLKLWLQVARAVAAAHRNLIVHQDIKPANVLVDERGRVRLLDFGISKLLGGVGEQAELAAITPEYAAPEQFAGLDITVQTDVYQLGGLLRQILTGQVPMVAGQAMEDVAPSSQVSDPNLKRRLSGSLDAVIMKAQAALPSARYDSVDMMAADIKRFLDKLPLSISARPTRDLMVSFLRRNPIGAGAIGLAAFLLIGWAITASTLTGLYKREQDKALTEAARATRVKDAMVEILRRADPLEIDTQLEPGADSLSYLVAAADSVELQLADDPEVLVEILPISAALKQRLDRWDDLLATRKRARDLEEKLYGPDHPKTLASEAVILTWTIAPRSSAEIDEDEALIKANDILARAKNADPQVDPDALSSAFLHLGYAFNAFSNWARVEESFLRVISLSEEFPEIRINDKIEAAMILGQAYKTQNRMDDAETFYNMSVSNASERFGAGHYRLVGPLAGLAEFYSNTAQHDLAIDTYIRAIAIAERYDQSDGDVILKLRNNLAASYGQAGQHVLAAEEQRRIIELRQGFEEPNSLELGTNYQNLGVALEKAGDWAPALESYGAASRLYAQTLPEKNVTRYLPFLSMARLNTGRENWDAARQNIRDARAGLTPLLPEGHFIFGMLDCFEGQGAAAMGRDNADILLRSGLEKLGQTPGREAEIAACAAALQGR